MRWRTRTLMLMVAFVAITLGLYRETRRRVESYRYAATYHASASAQLSSDAGRAFCSFGRMNRLVNDPGGSHALEDRLNLAASKYHARLYEKYQLAAERP